ncbi:hypothetical protein Sjap_014035 [Stephania japonica]|uniref:Transcription repressor n=1 Tax=Stephania japonica TaxID=461633 RepID=A0AAP0NZ65_9MAGN
MQFLYEAGYGLSDYNATKGIIGISQLRHVAVLATAKRVAYELGLRLGKEVGFQEEVLGVGTSIESSILLLLFNTFIDERGEQALSQFHPNPSSAIAVLSKAQCLFSKGVPTISSLAHAMVQDRLDQMIRERFVQSRNEGGRRESERYGDGNSDDTKCIVMVAMDKYSHNPRKDFRDSMVEMITANQIEAEQKRLDHHINYMMD